VSARIPGADSWGGGPAGEGDREVVILDFVIVLIVDFSSCELQL
jgi:hypothetical protein